LCFFGGEFVLLIAAVEAYRSTGWESTLKCITDLYTDFNAVAEASKKDDKVDADKDGVADVNQITSKELIHRKTILFIETVEPKRFTDALAGLNVGFVAVVATLKLQVMRV
jgi:hypothetical protein